MKIVKGKEQEYLDARERNSDPYSRRCFTYAEDWAEMMEKKISEGCTVTDVAEPLSREADTDGITGFMYGAAVSVLANFWEHGEQLRLWHNLKTQLGREGERANVTGGVLNPAVLCIGE